MKTAIKRLTAILLVIATIGTYFAFSASAATAVKSVDCQNRSNPQGKTSVYFYVKANGSKCKIKFTCGEGRLDWVGDGGITFFDPPKIKGAYEVKIYKWDKSKNAITGSCLFDKDVYNTSSYTASFSAKKGCYYRVQVYFWKAATTAQSYWNHGYIYNPYPYPYYTISGKGDKGVTVCFAGDPSLLEFPTITAKNGGNCTLYATKP